MKDTKPESMSLECCHVLSEISSPSWREVGLVLDDPADDLVRVGPGPKRSEAPTCPERPAIRRTSPPPDPGTQYSLVFGRASRGNVRPES